jgi:AraC family transcriptional regulator, regulatory protein of adaptative response / methylated-DNA-[protein]-cysteine methyltransferase
MRTHSRRKPLPPEGEVLHHAQVATPLGTLRVAADDRAVVLLGFADDPAWQAGLEVMARRRGCTLAAGLNPVAARLTEELESYFGGALERFSTPLSPAGTEFQRRAWRALASIPYGETISYGEQARRIGRPTAVRAVAQANGANPIAIVLPCHRVIGGDGSLTGYGGGLERKRWLLAHEARHAADQARRNPAAFDYNAACAWE